jgi:hypothetical protein
VEGRVPQPLVSPRVRGLVLGLVLGSLLGAAAMFGAVLVWSRIWEDDEVFDPSTTDFRGVVVEPHDPELLCIELRPQGQHGTSDSTRCAPSVGSPAIGTTVIGVLATWCRGEYEDCDAMWLEVDEI